MPFSSRLHVHADLIICDETVHEGKYLVIDDIVEQQVRQKKWENMPC